MAESNIQSDISKTIGDFSQADEPLVGIIVLHWNKIAETTLCIKSLSHLCYQNYHIYLRKV